MGRPTWDQYGLTLARAVATRADCTRRKVGAVLVSADHRVLSTGYNGSAPGGPSCLDGGCPRGLHNEVRICTGECVYDEEGEIVGIKSPYSICGRCDVEWPCDDAVPPGSSYDTGPGSCIAIHAEQNAIFWADPVQRRGATLYVTDKPCEGCERLIKGVGIERTVTP